MSFYYGLPYTKDQLVQLFAAYHGIKLSAEPTAGEIFDLIKLCEDWDEEGEYEDVEENIAYLVNELLNDEKVFQPYLVFCGNDEQLIGFELSVKGPITVQDIEPPDSEYETFKKSPLYPHLYSTPRVCYA